MKTTALFATTALLAATTANAGTVLVGGVTYGLLDAAGNFPTGPSKTMAIIDVDGDGLAGFDLANWDGSSFLPDADDVIVTDEVNGNGEWFEAAGDNLTKANADLLSGEEDGFTDALQVPTATYQFDLADVNTNTTVGAGDNVYLFWFPELELSASTPGSEQAFGILLLGALDPVGGVNFNNTEGTEAFIADQTTIVPEPSSLALLGLGGLAMLRRRRG